MNPPGARALLRAENLSAGYGDKAVLHGIDLLLEAGEFLALAGPNGTGKTTLLHCLTGHSPPFGGEVFLDEVPIQTLSRGDVAREVAFVPQFTHSIYGFSVRDMVLMGRFPYRGFNFISTREDVKAADEALEQLGVIHLRDRRFNELSGGERQLVLLARAMVQRARILMMDEPLTGLDLRHQFQVMEHLRTHADRPGCAVIATFHDLPVAARWGTRVMLLHGGRVAADGPPLEAITSDLLREIYGVNADVTTEGGGLRITVHSLDKTGSNVDLPGLN